MRRYKVLSVCLFCPYTADLNSGSASRDHHQHSAEKAATPKVVRRPPPCDPSTAQIKRAYRRSANLEAVARLDKNMIQYTSSTIQ